MKKYILRLGICAGLLAALLLLTMLIHNSMDDYVASKQPNQSTTVEAPPTVTMSVLTELDNETDGEEQENPANTTQTTTPGTTTPETTTPETTTPETTTPETTTPETTTPETTTPETTTPETTTPETTTPETTTPETTTPETTTPETTTPETTTPPAEEEKKPQGQVAPVVTFYNAAGNAITIESFRDKPVVLCYWASWATGSDDTLALLSKYYAEYSEKAHFVVINLTNAEKETREAADAYLADKNYPFPIYYDTDGVCRTSYSINTVPTTFFLEDEAYAVAYAKGKLTERIFLAGLEYILKEVQS